jgi:hypothetical protein
MFASIAGAQPLRRAAMLRRSCLVMLLASAAPLSAQGYIGGFVLDSATKAPIPCTVVALLDTAGHAVARQVTIDNGAFQFDAPPHGTYRLAFALWDFETLLAASEELDPTTEHARTYALNCRMVTDAARRPSRAQYPDSASDAPPKPLLGQGNVPELTSALRNSGQRDFSATFDVLVDSTGKAVPSSVKVTSSTDPRYGEVIEKFLKGAKFKPARLDHHPVCAWIRNDDIRTQMYSEVRRVQAYP